MAAIDELDGMMTGDPERRPPELKKRKKSGRCPAFNPAFVPLKLIFFFFLGGQGVIINYRSLFTKHLGLSTTQTGIIWTIDRVLGIFSPPLLGALSDKSRRPRDVIAVVFSICAIVLSTVVFVPRQHPSVDVTCHDTPLYPVIFPRSGLQAEKHAAYTSKKCYRFYLNDQPRSLCIGTGSHHNSTTGSHHHNNSTDAWMRSLNESFSVLGRVVNDCASSVNTTTFMLGKNDHAESRDYLCVDGSCEEDHSSGPSAILARSAATSGDEWTWTPSGASVTSCICSSEVERSSVYDQTFWIFLFMNLLISLAILSSQGLVDAFVINQLPSKKRHHFGYQRLWGSIGFGLTTLMGGYFKDIIIENVPGSAQTNAPFIPIFGLSALMCFLLTIAVKCTKERKLDDDQHSGVFKLSDVKALLYDIRIVMFLIIATAVGFSLGVGENYAFVFAVEKVHASGTVLGLSIGLASFLDVCMYLASTKILKKFGTNLVMIVGLLVLTSKLLLYTFCTEPWHFILVEQIRGLSWGITWTAVCNHATQVAPAALNATMMGLVSMGAWGVGYGLASLLGGVMYDSLGGAEMFQISFAAASSIAVIYSIFVFCMKGRKNIEVSKVVVESEELKTKTIEDLNNNV